MQHVTLRLCYILKGGTDIVSIIAQQQNQESHSCNTHIYCATASPNSVCLCWYEIISVHQSQHHCCFWQRLLLAMIWLPCGPATRCHLASNQYRECDWSAQDHRQTVVLPWLVQGIGCTGVVHCLGFHFVPISPRMSSTYCGLIWIGLCPQGCYINPDL